MNISALKTGLFALHGDVFDFFCEALQKQKKELSENTIVVIASKIVALAQGRKVQGSKKAIEKWVKKEAERYWKTEYPQIFLSLTNGILIANAGIDASNTEPETLILWPIEAQQFADEFRKQIQNRFSLQNIGVIVSDSRCTPLRAGVSGVALAWSGFEGVTDERGKQDLYGNPLQITKLATADNLSSAAELVMGNANESTPFVLCKDVLVKFTAEQQSPCMAQFPIKDDIFAPLYQAEIRET